MTDSDQRWIGRYLDGVRRHADGFDADLVFLAALELPHTPGWLTGEDMLAQGIEVTMPNLPRDLALPALQEHRLALRVRVVGPDAVRVTLAPPGEPVLTEGADWLGIVTSETTGPTTCTVTETEDAVQVATPALTLRVGRRPFTLQLGPAEAPVLRTAERLRQVAGFPMAPPVLAGPDTITLNLEIGADEDILGFGEQFGRLVKNGQELVLTVEDALGTGTGMTYKPVPVWHSSRGYTGFLNTGATVTADVGHRRPSVLGLTVADTAADLYLIAGATPAARLATYTTLTGRSRRPELWAFGYWLGRCRYHSAPEMIEVADRMRAERLPADVLHLDPDWLVVDRLNTDFIWNTGRFGDRRTFVSALAERGFRLSVWELPYIDPASPIHDEAETAGYLVRTTAGATAQVRGTPTPDGRSRSLADLSNPEARRWWQDLHAPFLADGVAVFKTDFGEGCPHDAALADGTPPRHAHNLFPLRYNGAVYEGIERLTGRTPLVWGRSGWAGSQRFPGQWGGDAESTVAGLQATLRGGLSYALCAPGYWSHDIGGFFGPELTPGLYVRWTQFGALSPLMRAHGLRPREPWAFGEEALAIAADWLRLRYSLLPYLWQVAAQTHSLGLPVMRPLVLEFPGDPVAAGIDDQFMLGADLLVAPVLDDGMRTVTRRVYLPAGRWHPLTGGEPVHGPGFITVEVPISAMPVYVRDGATLPRVQVDAGVRNADDLRDRPWQLHVYGDGPAATLEGFDGHPVEDAEVIRHG
ncbi:MAG: glycoside hydrolase family 31 protein [Propioniciclava sp.]|uniref:glycoside hydrolase family 31 protein n=1 Tax=Propioniciclava sp. TaxID=2038686 RepID=UPI0039E63F4D